MPEPACGWKAITGFEREVRLDEPMPTVQVHGRSRSENKPDYRVPSMDEIASVAPNGFSVVSTFSGCGGSCLGFRMAGYSVAWANEFVAAARETYRANNPATPLDDRDIRKIEPAQILKAIGLREGAVDVLEGSPPCASFSTAGKRESSWGQVKRYSDTQQRTDDLFFEFARILRGLKPKVFVAENVSGLVKGVAKGYFVDILRELKTSGYRVKAKLLDAQWLGVPQARQRIIFIGVREDLKREPEFPEPLRYRYSVRDALPWIVRAKYGPAWHAPTSPSPTVSADLAYNAASNHQGLELIEAEADITRYAIGEAWDRMSVGDQSAKYFQLHRPALGRPCPTVTVIARAGAAGVVHPTEKRRFSIAELKRICAFPDDYVLTGSYAQQWERLGRSVPPLMMRAIAETIRDRILGTRVPSRGSSDRSTNGSGRKDAV